MKKLIVLPIILILLGAWFIRPSKSEVKTEILPLSLPTATVTPTSQPFSQDKLWSLIQSWRMSQGLKPYVVNEGLCQVAQERAFNYPELDNHVGLPSALGNYPPSMHFYENLGRDFTEQEMLDGWLASPGHSKTLHTAYTYSCLRCKVEPQGGYCSQIFSNL